MGFPQPRACTHLRSRAPRGPELAAGQAVEDLGFSGEPVDPISSSGPGLSAVQAAEKKWWHGRLGRLPHSGPLHASRRTGGREMEFPQPRGCTHLRSRAPAGGLRYRCLRWRERQGLYGA